MSLCLPPLAPLFFLEMGSWGINCVPEMPFPPPPRVLSRTHALPSPSCTVLETHYVFRRCGHRLGRRRRRRRKSRGARRHFGPRATCASKPLVVVVVGRTCLIPTASLIFSPNAALSLLVPRFGPHSPKRCPPPPVERKLSKRGGKHTSATIYLPHLMRPRALMGLHNGKDSNGGGEGKEKKRKERGARRSWKGPLFLTFSRQTFFPLCDLYPDEGFFFLVRSLFPRCHQKEMRLGKLTHTHTQ